VTLRKWDATAVAVHVMTLSSRVPPNKARLVMTELRTRLPGGGQGPKLNQVLIAGMQELAAVDEDDLVAPSGAGGDSEMWEATVEV